MNATKALNRRTGRRQCAQLFHHARVFHHATLVVGLDAKRDREGSYRNINLVETIPGRKTS